LPYAINNGFRIHYQVVGSDGPPLILQHGLTQSSEDWKRFDYVKKIENDFRLILIDARGHGLSDKSYDPDDYRLSTRAMDVLAVMDHMSLDKTHYWGFSMGALIGYGLMLNAPNRIDRMVLGGGTALSSHCRRSDSKSIRTRTSRLFKTRRVQWCCPCSRQTS